MSSRAAAGSAPASGSDWMGTPIEDSRTSATPASDTLPSSHAPAFSRMASGGSLSMIPAPAFRISPSGQ